MTDSRTYATIRTYSLVQNKPLRVETLGLFFKPKQRVKP